MSHVAESITANLSLAEELVVKQKRSLWLQMLSLQYKAKTNLGEAGKLASLPMLCMQKSSMLVVFHQSPSAHASAAMISLSSRCIRIWKMLEMLF